MHAAQVDALVAPTADDADPAGHSEHADAPSPAPYVPAGQLTHWVALVMPAVVEKVPAGQKPSQTVVAVRGWYVPGAQRRHDERPVIGL